MNKNIAPSFFVPTYADNTRIIGHCWWCGQGIGEDESGVHVPLAKGDKAVLCDGCVKHAFADEYADAFAWHAFALADTQGHAFENGGTGPCLVCHEPAESYPEDPWSFLRLYGGYEARFDRYDALLCSPACVRELYSRKAHEPHEEQAWWQQALVDDTFDVSEPPLRARDRRHKPRA